MSAQRDLFAMRTARLSACGRYRYELTRIWGSAPLACWVLLNPSKADADYDDPTTRKLAGFAKAWNLGGFRLVNLFAYRATDPRELIEADRGGLDVVGPENWNHVRRAITAADSIAHVCIGWGSPGGTIGRSYAADVIAFAQSYRVRLWCIGRNQGGQPTHPLYQPYNRARRPYLVPVK